MAIKKIERRSEAGHDVTKKKESRPASPAAMEMFDRLALELSGLAAKEAAPAARPKPRPGKRAPDFLPDGRRLGRAALWS